MSFITDETHRSGFTTVQQPRRGGCPDCERCRLGGSRLRCPGSGRSGCRCPAAGRVWLDNSSTPQSWQAPPAALCSGANLRAAHLFADCGGRVGAERTGFSGRLSQIYRASPGKSQTLTADQLRARLFVLLPIDSEAFEKLNC